MKRTALAVICLVIPALLCLNAWQGYRYNELSNAVAALEKQQQDLLEANRDVIAQIAYEQSAARVVQKADRSFTLGPVDQSHITRVLVPASEGRQGP
jgi:ABC-type phosphate transport system auxiliary subunit